MIANLAEQAVLLCCRDRQFYKTSDVQLAGEDLRFVTYQALEPGNFFDVGYLEPQNSREFAGRIKIKDCTPCANNAFEVSARVIKVSYQSSASLALT